MPFVSKNSSKKINWDIRYDRYDPKTGEKIQDGNGLKSIELTLGDTLDYRPESERFQEIVVRGQPDSTKMCWDGSQMPVFRILTNRFKTDSQKDEKSDWARFMRDYKRELSGTMQREIYYEPSMQDVVVDEFKNYHFPLWVLEELIEMGELESALKTSKVDLPHVKKLTQVEYNRIKAEIEKRKSAEVSGSKKKAVGNVS